VDSAGTLGGADDFPTITLEGETNSTIVIRFVFAKAALEVVKKVTRGSTVVIRGTCSGRQLDQNRAQVRFDNCQLVDTTARESSVVRVLATDLARDYEEDLRPYYTPPRGTEPRVETPLEITALSKKWKAHRTSLEPYRLRIITVSGVAPRRQPPNRLVLESTETDQPLKAACLFASEAFARLGDGPAFRVTGLCTGMERDGVLRLDNCEVDPSQQRNAVPVLTADFLPHRPGNVLTYDLAVYPPLVKTGQVVRQIWYQRNQGMTETVVTHTLIGVPPGRSLFTTEKVESWVSIRRTKKSRLPGPVYLQQTSGTFVEVGQRPVQVRGGGRTVWEPILKLGAKPGDSWDWVDKNSKHVYTFVGFETFHGRRSAIVQEEVVNTIDQTQAREIRNVFVEGIGQVERREWQKITSKEKKLITERKMILAEELLVGPPKPMSGDDKPGMPKKEKK
jgi:hypothetical protein